LKLSQLIIRHSSRRMEKWLKHIICCLLFFDTQRLRVKIWSGTHESVCLELRFLFLQSGIGGLCRFQKASWNFEDVLSSCQTFR
jgi:hypothetical protein